MFMPFHSGCLRPSFLPTPVSAFKGLGSLNSSNRPSPSYFAVKVKFDYLVPTINVTSHVCTFQKVLLALYLKVAPKLKVSMKDMPKRKQYIIILNAQLRGNLIHKHILLLFLYSFIII